MKPVGFDPAKKYPMVLWIHGGPWSHVQRRRGAGPSRTSRPTATRSCGPTRAARTGLRPGLRQRHPVLAIPGKDYDDLMAGVDAALAKGFIDENNLFVCGGSGRRRADGLDRRPHRPVPRGRLDAAGDQLALVRRHHRRRELVPAVPEVPVGRPDGVRRALAAALRGQRHDADDGDDRRGGPADADPAERGVLPRAEDAEEGDRCSCACRRSSTAGGGPSHQLLQQLYLLAWFEKHKR